MPASISNRRGWILSTLLLTLVLGTAAGLASWKKSALAAEAAAAASMPEPVEVIAVAPARASEYGEISTSIGTMVALRSITLRNELSGTVREVHLTPGAVVEEGTLLVALDVAVEQAELQALEAQAALAETMLGRMERASQNRGASEMDVDRARAERDIALANVARTRALIDRMTIRAPFRARIGLSDVNVGQYLAQGTELTTLQGVDEAVHVDFEVSQDVASGLAPGARVEVLGGDGAAPIEALIVAVDARVDARTRNATVRARIADANSAPAPGASVRVRVPVGAPRSVVLVPASALRRGPAGDHVFVVEPDANGQLRAHLRPVQSGLMLGDEVMIRSGLAAGEQVAAAGSFKLREGVLVMVQG